MDLFIKTLSGTKFELRVSPFETILSIKSKLQRLEGIAISQQHLIWRSSELEDAYCLHDYGIKSGATLTLVLAMRGGPINMRRVSLEEPSLQEMAEYMDENRDELWDKLMNDNKQVTLLVYREGDQLNFYRVYDGGDGTLSPYSDSISASSAYNVNDEDSPSEKIIQKENLITKDKMKMLQEQIASKSLKKTNIIQQPHPPSTPSGQCSSMPSASLAKRRIQFSKHSKLGKSSPLKSKNERSSHSILGSRSERTFTPTKTNPIPPDKQKLDDTTRKPLPPVNRKGVKSSKDSSLSPSDKLSDSSLSSNRTSSPSYPSFTSNNRLPELKTNNGLTALPLIDKNDTSRKSARMKKRSLKPLGTVDKKTSSKLLQQIVTPSSPGDDDLRLHSSALSNESFLDAHLEETLRASQLPDIIRDPVEYENYKNLLKYVHPKSNISTESMSGRVSKISKEKDGKLFSRPASKSRRKTDSRSSSRLRSSKLHAQGNLTHLPAVNTDSKNHLSKLPSKKKPRCTICTKKLGLATTYQCRCGSKFCAQHRYPEAHTCTYDYKTEGRHLLQRSNPVVTAPKLPKI